MFSQLAIWQGMIPDHNSVDNLAPAARRLFGGALVAGRMKKVAAFLTGRSRRLNTLADVEAQSRIRNRYYAGPRAVALDHVRGTLDKADSFDIDFYPTQEHTAHRWIGVATAMTSGVTLPPVELIRTGDIYYVVDGHHRISVARALNHKYIDAIVTVWEI
jgi:hypothetical protein